MSTSVSGEEEEEAAMASPADLLDRSLPKEEHMLAGRMIASEELIFGSNVDATAMYDFVPTTRLKGNEEFIEETGVQFNRHFCRPRTWPRTQPRTWPKSCLAF